MYQLKIMVYHLSHRLLFGKSNWCVEVIRNQHRLLTPSFYSFDLMQVIHLGRGVAGFSMKCVISFLWTVQNNLHLTKWTDKSEHYRCKAQVPSTLPHMDTNNVASSMLRLTLLCSILLNIIMYTICKENV